MLIHPRWFNKFRRPTWVCSAKSCPHRDGNAKAASQVLVGRVYHWVSHNPALPDSVVRVIRRDGVYASVVGPRRTDVPYNFAYQQDLVTPTVTELQKFLEAMPCR